MMVAAMLLPLQAMAATLSVEKFEISANETKELLIDVNNSDMEVTMVEFYMTLPTGLSVVTEDDELVVEIAGRTTYKKHSLEAKVENGVLHVLLYSGSNAVLSGTEGAVISIKLTADSSYAGGKLVFKDQVLTSPDTKESKPAEFSYNLSEDEVTAYLSLEKFEINANETKELLIDVINTDMEVTMVEFFMSMPSGLTVATEDDELAVDIAGRTTYKKHSLEAKVENGVLHVLLYSGSNAVLSGTEGAVISIKLTADENYAGGELGFKNIVLTAPDTKESKPTDFNYSLIGEGTGIASVKQQVSDNAPVYTLGGQLVKASTKGIYVSQGKKFIVK